MKMEYPMVSASMSPSQTTITATSSSLSTSSSSFSTPTPSSQASATINKQHHLTHNKGVTNFTRKLPLYVRRGQGDVFSSSLPSTPHKQQYSSKRKSNNSYIDNNNRNRLDSPRYCSNPPKVRATSLSSSSYSSASNLPRLKVEVTAPNSVATPSPLSHIISVSPFSSIYNHGVSARYNPTHIDKGNYKRKASFTRDDHLPYDHPSFTPRRADGVDKEMEKWGDLGDKTSTGLVFNQPDFQVTWKIPTFKERYFGKTICSHVCAHASGLKFQIAACVVEKSYYCFYIVCSNAHEFAVDEYADVSWELTVGDDCSSHTEKRGGKVRFSREVSSNFSSACLSFMALKKFERLLPQFISSEDQLVVNAKMIINSTFDPCSEQSTTVEFESGDVVAVCAPNNGFWIARLEGKLKKNSRHRDDPVLVQWFEESPPNSGKYVKTPFADHISVDSVHPVKISLQFHTLNGDKFYTIRETRSYLDFLLALKAEEN
eukprot:m.194043 g.194043  ORF g.194043 m.194043 type:complete len:487 (-) comp13657_c3_seq2:1300-2760(-)